MGSVRRNIIANYAGGLWSALMSFAFVPLQVHYIGIEGYGLVGIYASMQVWFALLDMGIAPAVSREMARFGAGAHTARSIRELFNSLELVYICLAGLLAAIVAGGSSWIAGHWLNAQSLPLATVAQTIALIGCVAALRWIGAFYRGVLIGLQRQVWLSTFNSVFATLRGGAVVLVLAWISPTVQAFFLFQGIVGLVEISALAIVGTRRNLPQVPEAARFSWPAVRQVWRFAGGMALITVISILLTQVDKLVLSKLLSLSQFGYYMLAYTAASVLHLMTTPVGNAAYPRLTELVTAGDSIQLAATYHGLSQTITLVLVPITVVMALFPQHVLLLWTHDPVITAAAAPVFSMLLIGNMLNGLYFVPYNLQLAHGWTRFSIQVNLVALAILVPVIYFGVRKVGPLAAAAAWVALNASYIFVALPIMHRRLLPGEKWRWYRQDVLGPAAAIVAAVILVRLLSGPADPGAPFTMVATLGLAAVVAFAAAALTIPRARLELWARLGAK
jgi:O-antigen/teichoic acid export membrane protein